MASGDSQSTARMNLLAELPHVGREPVIAPVASPAISRTSTHPAFAAYDDEPIELAQTRTKRYVDQAHRDDEDDDEEFERHEKRRRTDNSSVRRQRPTVHKPHVKPGVSGLLSQAHQQVAPFAGLIVTTALVAAAGLLFHMMAGDNKSKAELDEFSLPGFQVNALENSLPTNTSAPLAEVSANPESLEPQSLSTGPAELTPIEDPAQKAPAAAVGVQTAPPLAEANDEATTPLGQLSFPQTGTPLALDYTKATDPDLLTLPEVAERTEASPTEGINR
jgi:hypothetical protein